MRRAALVVWVLLVVASGAAPVRADSTAVCTATGCAGEFGAVAAEARIQPAFFTALTAR
jgi:hypothetical protein